jgi:hypothetical protein
MVQQTTITRGGKQYIHYKGKDDLTGDSVDYIDQVLPDEKTGWPVRFEPVRQIIERSTKGGTAQIYSEYQRVLVDTNGDSVPGTAVRSLPEGGTLSLAVDAVDKQFFIDNMGAAIINSGTNGFVKKMLGFADMPVYDDFGEVITYTTEQENAPKPTEPA